MGPFFSVRPQRLDALKRDKVVVGLASTPLMKDNLGQQVAQQEGQLREPTVVNSIKADYDQELVEEPLKPRLRWLFLAALVLVLWQVPLINVAYSQAGIRTFLQTAFQNGELPPHLLWSGRVEADPTPAMWRLEQANDPFIPLQMSLDVDRPLGVAALMTGNAIAARQRLLSRLERTPEDHVARFFLGEAYRRLGDTSTAIEQWTIAGAQEPLMALAKDLIEREEKSTALAALEALMRLNKTDTEPRWLAADILSEQGATQQALALYQEIRTLNPHSEAAHRRVANLWLQQGNLEQALTVYQEMIDNAPQQATGYALMGRALFEAGHYEQAIKFLEQALQRDPEEPDLLLEMQGESYAAQERWAEAIQAYKQAIDLNFNRQRAYTLMGEAQCQVGTPEEARFYFEQAVALGSQQEQVRQAIQYITQQGVCPP